MYRELVLEVMTAAGFALGIIGCALGIAALLTARDQRR